MVKKYCYENKCDQLKKNSTLKEWTGNGREDFWEGGIYLWELGMGEKLAIWEDENTIVGQNKSEIKRRLVITRTMVRVGMDEVGSAESLWTVVNWGFTMNDRHIEVNGTRVSTWALFVWCSDPHLIRPVGVCRKQEELEIEAGLSSIARPDSKNLMYFFF